MFGYRNVSFKINLIGESSKDLLLQYESTKASYCSRSCEFLTSLYLFEFLYN